MNLPSIEVLFVVFLVRVISAPFKKNHVSYISEFTPFVSVILRMVLAAPFTLA